MKQHWYLGRPACDYRPNICPVLVKKFWFLLIRLSYFSTRYLWFTLCLWRLMQHQLDWGHKLFPPAKYTWLGYCNDVALSIEFVYDWHHQLALKCPIWRHMLSSTIGYTTNFLQSQKRKGGRFGSSAVHSCRYNCPILWINFSPMLMTVNKSRRFHHQLTVNRSKPEALCILRQGHNDSIQTKPIVYGSVNKTNWAS